MTTESFKVVLNGGTSATHLYSTSSSSSSSRKMTLKKISMEEGDRDLLERLRREDRVLASCRSPHLVRRVSSFVVGSEFFSLREEVDSVSTSYLRENVNLSEAHIAAIIAPVLAALRYLHRNNLVHFGVRAENIVVALADSTSRCVVKLDGLFDTRAVESLAPAKATHWMAPEVIQCAVDDGGGAQRSMPAIDIWALGITAIELACGKPPYADRSPSEAMRLLLSRGLPRDVAEKNLSSKFLDFVGKCLRSAPGNRPTAAELLRHDFVSAAAAKSSSSSASVLFRPWQGVTLDRAREGGRSGSFGSSSLRIDERAALALDSVGYERVVTALGIRRVPNAGYDDRISFFETSGGALLPPDVSDASRHRELRAILRESLASAIGVCESGGDETTQCDGSRGDVTMAIPPPPSSLSFPSSTKRTDASSSPFSSSEDEGEEDEDGDENIFAPLTSKLDGNRSNRSNLSAPGRVLEQAVQQCIALHGSRDAPSAGRVTVALAGLRAAICALDEALPDGTLSRNFLASCVRSARNSQVSSVRSIVEDPSTMKLPFSASSRRRRKRREGDLDEKQADKDAARGALSRELLGRWKGRV